MQWPQTGLTASGPLAFHPLPGLLVVGTEFFSYKLGGLTFPSLFSLPEEW